MKYLLFILFLTIVSCSNTDTKVKVPEKETTIELIRLSEIDTISYKRVELKGTTYLISNNEVKYKIPNQSGEFDTALIICFILMVLVGILFITRD